MKPQHIFLPFAILLWLPAQIGAADADIIINEIMYHPPVDLEDAQYIELYNRGSNQVDLSRWSFTKGVKFTFPENTVLAPNAWLVVCRNRQTFGKYYGYDMQLLGNFGGSLSHSGEKVELSNARGVVIDSLNYRDAAPWPSGPDGHSPALERICPSGASDDPYNWAASAWGASGRSSGTPGRKNDNWSATPVPAITKVSVAPAVPLKPIVITAQAAHASVLNVALLYTVPDSGSEPAEKEIPMPSTGNNTYAAAIPAQPPDTLIRFRIRAVDAAGNSCISPHPNEPRPAYSCGTYQKTNNARIPFAYVYNFPGAIRGSKMVPATNASPNIRQIPRQPIRITRDSLPSRNRPNNNSAFIYVPPGGGQVLLFDFVEVRQRNGGFKVHFHKDQPFQEMTGINVIFEYAPRYVLSEPLAYEIYRLANVPAPLTEHLRVWRNGRLLGYHLSVEQPNKAFLARNQRDTSGNLYKLLWYGNGIIGQHEKKTQVSSGHDDLIALIEALRSKSGGDQWAFIEKSFNVQECIDYYVVNMCIQNWDGFHNNYFTYHDTGRTDKWEIYPWDEDKTWGDYDGASSKHDWYEMPLTMGMTGDRSPVYNPISKANNRRGNFGGLSWWRAGGWFSGPLLANTEFRKRFLARLRQFCETEFTEEKVVPLINAMEKRLEAEVLLRARLNGQGGTEALANFQNDMQSFRNQVKFRREFILKNCPVKK